MHKVTQHPHYPQLSYNLCPQDDQDLNVQCQYHRPRSNRKFISWAKFLQNSVVQFASHLTQMSATTRSMCSFCECAYTCTLYIWCLQLSKVKSWMKNLFLVHLAWFTYITSTNVHYKLQNVCPLCGQSIYKSLVCQRSISRSQWPIYQSCSITCVFRVKRYKQCQLYMAHFKLFFIKAMRR